MKIHTRDQMATVGVVELEPKDEAQYIGHFTVESLLDFGQGLKKKYSPTKMLALKLVFQGNGYVIAAAEDDEFLHVAVAGCGHGRDGTE